MKIIAVDVRIGVVVAVEGKSNDDDDSNNPLAG